MEWGGRGRTPGLPNLKVCQLAAADTSPISPFVACSDARSRSKNAANSLSIRASLKNRRMGTYAPIGTFQSISVNIP